MKSPASLFLAVAAASLLMAFPAAGQEPGTAARFIGSTPNTPFARAVVAGNTVYVSGMIAMVKGGLIEGGIQPETRRSMERIAEALAEAGATMDDVVKCTVFLADMDEWASMNEVYTTFFPKHRPARSAVAVAGLARDARVEIECVAVLGAGGGRP